MFIEDFGGKSAGKYFDKLAREACTYNAKYIYWRDILFERVMRLFVWNTGEDVLPKEIEQRLLLNGHCGITKLPKESKLTAMFGSFHGVTKYLDEYTEYNVRCPIYAGDRVIGKTVAVINNNKLKNPVYPLVHHYAMLLAHADVTTIDALIDLRDKKGAPVATSEIQKQSIIEYQRKRFNGEYGTITDLASMGTSFIGSNTASGEDIVNLLTARDQILRQFYSDIGVRSAFQKRSNTIEQEVEADTGLLLLNLSDMLESRQEGCERVNKLYGTNWSVKIADEISYALEEEPAEATEPAEEGE